MALTSTNPPTNPTSPPQAPQPGAPAPGGQVQATTKDGTIIKPTPDGGRCEFTPGSRNLAYYLQSFAAGVGLASQPTPPIPVLKGCFDREGRPIPKSK